jgi:hypothetical protein
MLVYVIARMSSMGQVSDLGPYWPSCLFPYLHIIIICIANLKAMKFVINVLFSYHRNRVKKQSRFYLFSSSWISSFIFQLLIIFKAESRISNLETVGSILEQVVISPWQLIPDIWSFEPRHDKTNIMRLRPAWIQTSLRIRAVW